MLDPIVKEKILERAIYLDKYGLNDLAWTKEDAQTLIRAVMKDRIGILGGDLYQLNHGRVEPLYDNWSCEPRGNEEEEEYYSRSKIESLSYIDSYVTDGDKGILFSITFTEKLI